MRTLEPSVQARGVPTVEMFPFEEEDNDFETAQNFAYAELDGGLPIPKPSTAPVETAAKVPYEKDVIDPGIFDDDGPTCRQFPRERYKAMARDVPRDNTAAQKPAEGGKGVLAVVDDEAAADAEDSEEERVPAPSSAEHILGSRAHPLQRTSVNADVFDLQTCGRNMLVGSTGRIPFPFRCIPLPLPSPLRLPLPMVVPLPFAREHTRVRLTADGGTWLNHAVKSPVAPVSPAFSSRRTDPMEAMQRRPFMVIPLDVTGPAKQPHPLCEPLKESDVSGGMAYSMGHMRPNGQGSLSYMEVRAGGPSQLSCVGLVDAEETFDDETPDETRQADFSGSPRGECVSATASGAFQWGFEGAEMVNSELADRERSFRAGDRVGILVDLDAGRMAVLKNGEVVLERKGLPADRTFRFFVGCHQPGASWTMIDAVKARRSLEAVDWVNFYSF